jgi:hypothetical protein
MTELELYRGGSYRLTCAQPLKSPLRGPGCRVKADSAALLLIGAPREADHVRLQDFLVVQIQMAELYRGGSGIRPLPSTNCHAANR